MTRPRETLISGCALMSDPGRGERLIAVIDERGASCLTTRTPPQPRRLIVGGSLLGGLVAAIALVVAAPVADHEYAVTAAVLLGFAIGWTLLSILTTRYTDRPHRWAAAPAVAMALTATGLIVLAPGDAALSTLGWVWSPWLIA